jgi:NAD(P)-dependent dehydrogenase (short-subunit alcohol dehydrogenase family)
VNLAERVAVVTGGGSGLGAAMARAFAAEGMRVAVLDIDGANADAVAAGIVHDGAEAIAARVDVADRASVVAAAALVQERFGGCHLVCANVGVQQFGAIERLTTEDWQWVLSVNVMGVVHTVDAFLPLLRARAADGDGRRFLLTSSSSVLSPGVRLGAYVASKHAITGYGEVLRLELEAEGIGVTTMFPAGMATRHLESSVAARPAELGPSVMMPDDIEAMLATRDASTSVDVASPEHAVRNLVADLQAGEPYVITHGDYRGQVEAHHAEIIAAFHRMERS